MVSEYENELIPAEKLDSYIRNSHRIVVQEQCKALK